MTLDDYRAQQKLEAKFQLIEADMTTAIQNQRSAIKINRRTTSKVRKHREAWAEAQRREIAFNHARYGQTGEG